MSAGAPIPILHSLTLRKGTSTVLPRDTVTKRLRALPQPEQTQGKGIYLTRSVGPGVSLTCG